MVTAITITGLLTVLSQVPAPRSTPATQTVPVTSQHSSNRMYTAISGHEGQVVACIRLSTGVLIQYISLTVLSLLSSSLCFIPTLAVLLPP